MDAEVLVDVLDGVKVHGVVSPPVRQAVPDGFVVEVAVLVVLPTHRHALLFHARHGHFQVRDAARAVITLKKCV